MRRRVCLAALIVFATVASLTVSLPSASAATPKAIGTIDSVTESAADTIVVVGWAFQPARSAASSSVGFWVDGSYVHIATANVARPDVDKKYKITGKHGFRVAFRWPHIAKSVTVRLRDSTHTLVRTRAVRQLVSDGTRIVTEAKKFVGKTRYVSGGTSPTKGFDCSGYVQYVFRVTGVATLPRTAEQQRRSKGMRLISKASARPGDLVFYLSGGRAYHVAMYAGKGKQYAAATPRDGIRFQNVWSSAVQYRTDWH